MPLARSYDTKDAILHLAISDEAMATKKKLPKPNPTHRSLKPDGSDKNKGSYFRRIEDIKKGLKKIDASNLPPGGRHFSDIPVRPPDVRFRGKSGSRISGPPGPLMTQAV